MKRVDIEPYQYRMSPLCLPCELPARGPITSNPRVLPYFRPERVMVVIRAYTSDADPYRVEYAGRHGDTVYCEPTLPDEWLEFVVESASS